MSERIRHNSKKISLHTAAYFIAIMVMLRPANPALQSLFGATLGEILNVILKLGDYILITGVIFYAVAYRIIRRNSILTIQSRLICCFLAVLTISTFLNGTLDNFRAYYEYLGNIFCIVFLYQKARTNQRRFNAFLQGAACFLTLAMLLNSLSIYIYYPNGMYVLDDGVTGNNNYYLFSLDNVGFIISLCSFGVSAVYDQFIGKKIKRSTIFKYIIVFGAYFYCRAATAIIVGIMLLIALVLYRIKWLRGLNLNGHL